MTTLFFFLALSWLTNIGLIILLLKSYKDRDNFAEQIYRDITEFQVEEI